MSNNRGFIYTRTVIAILIVLTILPILISAYSLIAKYNIDYNLLSNEISIMDLRRVLLLAYDIKINSHEMHFIYHNENYVLRLSNNKLILQPGTQIYLNDIKEINFNTKNGSIYLTYITNKGKEYEKNIGKEKGFYLADFSNNNDQPDDDDHIDF